MVPLALKKINFSNISALQMFQGMRFFSAILISVLLVKSGLELKQISFYEVLFFLGNFISLFWVQGLKNGLLSFYPAQNKTGQRSLLFNLFIIFFALGILAAYLLFAFKEPLIEYLTQYENIPHIGLISIFVAINTPTILNEFIYLLTSRPKKIIRYGIIVFTLQSVLVGIALFAYMDIRSILIFLIGWAIFKMVWLLGLLYKEADFQFDLGLQKKFLIFSFPLVLHILLGNAMEYVDGFIVSKFFKEEVFAIFRYGARELPINLILVGALVNAIVPVLVKDFDESLILLKRKTTQLMKWLFPLSMVLMLLSPVIYPIVYSDAFRASANIFNLYLLILGSRIILSQAIIYARHDNVVLAGSAAIELVINLLLSLWWVKLFNLEGIVYATIVAFLINKILLVAYCQWKYKLPPAKYLHIPLYLGFNILLLLCYFITLQY